MSTQKTGISTIAGNGDSPLAQGEFEWHCVSEMGVEFKPGTPIDYWLNAVKQALDMYEGSVKLRTRIKFILGDMLAFGESAFGESYAQAIDQTRRALDLSEKSLSNLQWIAPRIPIAARHDDLSFAHYEAVAALPDDGKKAEYLHRALAENLTARALKKEVKAEFPPEPKPASKTRKAVIDLESEEGLQHAAAKVAEWFTAYLESAEGKETPLKDWTEARKQKWESLASLAKIARRMGILR